ncbi:hypothetical protein ACKVWC_007011 [Pyricularia oryzae]
MSEVEHEDVAAHNAGDGGGNSSWGGSALAVVPGWTRLAGPRGRSGGASQGCFSGPIGGILVYSMNAKLL